MRPLRARRRNGRPRTNRIRPIRGLRGGFWFGKKDGEMLPFMNPVSTAFCAQALALWDQHCRGEWQFRLDELI